MMKPYPKPRIIISRCIEFDRCRYNGQMISSRIVVNLKPYVNFIPVCPEVEIELGVPRNPIRIVETDKGKILFQPATGRDVTEKMNKFTDEYLNSIEEIDGFVLKYKSPSCGPSNVKIFHGTHKSAGAGKGSGLFAGEVKERFPGLLLEDEGRLANFNIREAFLTKIFTLARFRDAKESGKMDKLVEFHTNHKLLLLAYNQSKMRKLGKIVANHEKKKIDHVFSDYKKDLKMAFAISPKFTSIINVLEHAFGGLSKNLIEDEKKFFLNSIEEYRDERIPLSNLIHLLKAWAIRFNNEYLLNQYFLDPFPKELTALTDSGKGRILR
jgi:uncharacterized protein YbgA (DUF1722 family)/uncharacterized protein YbbK (DUF523 family)